MYTKKKAIKELLIAFKKIHQEMDKQQENRLYQLPTDRRQLNENLYLYMHYNYVEIIKKILQNDPFKHKIKYLKRLEVDWDINHSHGDPSSTLMDTAISYNYSLEMIDVLYKAGWRLTKKNVLCAILNNAEASLKHILPLVNLDVAVKNELAVKARKEGKLSLVNLLTDQPLFYFWPILEKITEENFDVEKLTYDMISLAYLNANMQEVDAYCNIFLEEVNNKFSLFIMQTKKAVDAARESFLQWGTQLVRWRTKRALSEIEITYGSFYESSPPFSRLEEERKFGLRNYKVITDILKQIKKGVELRQSDYDFCFVPSITAAVSLEFKPNIIYIALEEGVFQYSIGKIIQQKITLEELNKEIGWQKATLIFGALGKLSPKEIKGKLRGEILQILAKRNHVYEISSSIYNCFPLPSPEYKDYAPPFSMRYLLHAFSIARCKEAELRDDMEQAKFFMRVNTGSQNKKFTTLASNNRYDGAVRFIQKMDQLEPDDKNWIISKSKNLDGYQLLYQNIPLTKVCFKNSYWIDRENFIQFPSAQLAGWRWYHGAENKETPSIIWPVIEKLHKEVFSMRREHIKKNPQLFYDKIVEVIWLLGNLTPTHRGTGRYVEQWLTLAHLYHKLCAPILKMGLQLDCLDLSFSLPVYKVLFLDFFEANSLEPFVKRYNDKQYQSNPQKQQLAEQFFPEKFPAKNTGGSLKKTTKTTAKNMLPLGDSLKNLIRLKYLMWHCNELPVFRNVQKKEKPNIDLQIRLAPKNTK